VPLVLHLLVDLPELGLLPQISLLEPLDLERLRGLIISHVDHGLRLLEQTQLLLKQISSQVGLLELLRQLFD
jgi:hypothetical protein